MTLWREARTRFTDQLKYIEQHDLSKKLPPSVNSVGFIIRHIGDVELLFTKNVFGNHSLKVHAKTVIAQKDTGEWTDLNDLIHYTSESEIALQTEIEKQTDQDWETLIETKEFGIKTKAEALGRVISHTAYHAGQLKLIHKYGI